jgi:hypothetical protein
VEATTPISSRARRLLTVAAVVVLLVATMVAARLADPAIPRAGQVGQPSMSTVVQSTTPPADDSSVIGTPSARPGPLVLPEWISWVLLVACAALVLGIVVALVWFALREVGLRLRQAAARAEAQGEPKPLRPARDVVADAIDLGLAELDEAGTDPRRVVIACWVRLEQAARDEGMERGVADTATDVVRRLLAKQMVVSETVLDRFAAAYLEARYADHVVSDDLRDQARAALAQLRAELQRPVRVPGPDETTPGDAS